MRDFMKNVVIIFAAFWAVLFTRYAQSAETSATTPGAVAQSDTYSDTWAATDALGRHVLTNEDVGPPRADRTVGIFYFLWHGAHVQGGPYDVTQILLKDPQAMQKKDSPLWGPMYAPHHWGQSIFGYYLTDDAGVLRKHAQMLTDAGVDVVIFDVTNQITYKPYYMALLRVFFRGSRRRRPGAAGGVPVPLRRPGQGREGTLQGSLRAEAIRGSLVSLGGKAADPRRSGACSATSSAISSRTTPRS